MFECPLVGLRDHGVRCSPGRTKGKKMSRETILEVSGLSAGYGDQVAVKNVSFSLAKGEIVCLAGESGCGKSTILKALLSYFEV